MSEKKMTSEQQLHHHHYSTFTNDLQAQRMAVLQSAVDEATVDNQNQNSQMMTRLSDRLSDVISNFFSNVLYRISSACLPCYEIVTALNLIPIRKGKRGQRAQQEECLLSESSNNTVIESLDKVEKLPPNNSNGARRRNRLLLSGKGRMYSEMSLLNREGGRDAAAAGGHNSSLKEIRSHSLSDSTTSLQLAGTATKKNKRGRTRNNDQSDLGGSKSGSPSPIATAIAAAAANSATSASLIRHNHNHPEMRDVNFRDVRESSVNSKSSADSCSNTVFFPERMTTTTEGDLAGSNPEFEGYRGPANKHGGSTTSLASRSDSMLSLQSQDGSPGGSGAGGRYGTVVVRGDVELGMLYSLASGGGGSLELAVKQCRDLAPVDSKRNRSDPYVKVYLLPDKSKNGKRKTKVKKHTLNPVFDEILKFQLPQSEVERRTLWLTVWHSDMFGRNDFLGEVTIPLLGQSLDDPSPKWFGLQDRTETVPLDDLQTFHYRGDLAVALKFVPPPTPPPTAPPPSSSSSSSSPLRTQPSQDQHQSNVNNRKAKGVLMVVVREAKNLLPAKGSSSVDPFCKIYLLPDRTKSSKQKTSICRRTSNPKWDHSVNWEGVSLHELADRSLEVSVWDHDRLGHSGIVGGARFNLGNGKHLGKPSPWMDSTGKEVTLWQQMLDKPNFWVEGVVNIRPPDKMNSTPSPI